MRAPRPLRDTDIPFASHDRVQVDPAPLTEAGAAERFTQWRGDDVRYDHRRNRWLLWQGHRWVPDVDDQIVRLGLDFARDWQQSAVTITDTERRKKTFTAAVRLEHRRALLSMLELAAAMKPIADAGTNWDLDPWLLGAPNGVIDLRDGTLRPGERDDRLTMSTGVAFDPDATCSRFEQFIVDTFANQPELMTFVHRAIGYSVSGDVSEQVLFLGYGTGSNGKGLLTQTLSRVLGDYSYTMPFSTIELHQRSAIPNDLAALLNRRFVSASETNDGTRLNESRVKALTGCDPITARFLHAEFFTFDPVGKYWLSVNHKPVVRDDSHGFWRRLRLIPFDQTFPVNKALGPELHREGPGILAWCVRGCLDWQRYGLAPPDVVLNATAAYQADSDVLGSFLTEATDQDPDHEVRASTLYEHYRTWAAVNGFTDRERLSATVFGRKVGERFHAKKGRHGKVYLGVKTAPIAGQV